MARKTVDDWVAKGWQALTIPAGSTDPVDISYDPATQDLVVKGQIYDPDGNQLTGHGIPKVRVEAGDDGGTITLRAIFTSDVTVLYKVVEEDDADGGDTA